ncbi:hypothetical protein ACFL56_00430 [Candidatus Margulisiibacteriota bacterium]
MGVVYKIIVFTEVEKRYSLQELKVSNEVFQIMENTIQKCKSENSTQEQSLQYFIKSILELLAEKIPFAEEISIHRYISLKDEHFLQGTYTNATNENNPIDNHILDELILQNKKVFIPAPLEKNSIIYYPAVFPSTPIKKISTIINVTKFKNALPVEDIEYLDTLMKTFSSILRTEIFITDYIHNEKERIKNKVEEENADNVHDLSKPLREMNTKINLIFEFWDKDPEKAKELLQSLRDDVGGSKKRMKKFTTLHRLKKINLIPDLNLTQFIENYFKNYITLSNNKKWPKLTFDIIRKDILVPADEDILKALFDNIISNAIDACEKTGKKYDEQKIEISLNEFRKQNKNIAIVAFKNNGPPMQRELISKINHHDPMYSTGMKNIQRYTDALDWKWKIHPIHETGTKHYFIFKTSSMSNQNIDNYLENYIMKAVENKHLRPEEIITLQAAQEIFQIATPQHFLLSEINGNIKLEEFIKKHKRLMKILDNYEMKKIKKTKIVREEKNFFLILPSLEDNDITIIYKPLGEIIQKHFYTYIETDIYPIYEKYLKEKLADLNLTNDELKCYFTGVLIYYKRILDITPSNIVKKIKNYAQITIKKLRTKTKTETIKRYECYPPSQRPLQINIAANILPFKRDDKAQVDFFLKKKNGEKRFMTTDVQNQTNGLYIFRNLDIFQHVEPEDTLYFVMYWGTEERNDWTSITDNNEYIEYNEMESNERKQLYLRNFKYNIEKAREKNIIDIVPKSRIIDIFNGHDDSWKTLFRNPEDDILSFNNITKEDIDILNIKKEKKNILFKLWQEALKNKNIKIHLWYIDKKTKGYKNFNIPYADIAPNGKLLFNEDKIDINFNKLHNIVSTGYKMFLWFKDINDCFKYISDEYTINFSNIFWNNKKEQERRFKEDIFIN